MNLFRWTDLRWVLTIKTISLKTNIVRFFVRFKVEICVDNKKHLLCLSLNKYELDDTIRVKNALNIIGNPFKFYFKK